MSSKIVRLSCNLMSNLYPVRSFKFGIQSSFVNVLYPFFLTSGIESDQEKLLDQSNGRIKICYRL